MNTIGDVELKNLLKYFFSPSYFSFFTEEVALDPISSSPKLLVNKNF